MYELMRLSGQEHVDLYAADVEGGQYDAASRRPQRQPLSRVRARRR